ncbi:HET-domain-containing protein [Lophium mytilinum]|uniref:HET-domain-containing protein n=1 Tax=Lophium mytilinum TaxID=390894 RepID=A0A6A6QGS2_9PEZI|nr:HET-domain-containing protein [Lophium mytilinum]
MARYQYTRLLTGTEEIRVLKLLPGSFHDAIRMELSLVRLVVPELHPVQRMSLKEIRSTLPSTWQAVETVEGDYIFYNSEDDHTYWRHPDAAVDSSRYARPPEAPGPGFQPQYEALSYSWDLTESPEDAYVEPADAASSKNDNTIPITQNLASALRHLRYPYKPRNLWVDAVCINQHDEIERNEQVKRMANIYRLAERVVVWLGPQSENSELAIRTLDYLGAQSEFCKGQILTRSPSAIEVHWFDSTCDLPYNLTTSLATQNLLSRPWFSRLWVWQEVQLANSLTRMQCGHKSISWSRLRRAVVCLWMKGGWPAQFHEALANLEPLTQPLQTISFGRLLYSMTTQKCSDPRDRIYGLLGLTSSALASRIEPQYSLPVTTVYKEAFLIYLDHFHRLDLLRYCSLENMLAGSASWIPNWSAPAGKRLGYSSVSSGASRASARYLAPNVLEVDGVHCATVSVVTEPPAWKVEDALRDFQAWALDSLYQTTPYITGESREDAFVLALGGNLVKERCPAYSFALPTQKLKDLVFENISNRANNCHIDPASVRALKHAIGIVWGGRFLTTREGYIGLGPMAAQPGDYVCVLLGSNDQMLLRPHPAGSFQVVGSVYVHGLSDATALLGPIPAPWTVHVDDDDAGEYRHRFFNSITGQHHSLSEDPRLEPLPPEWEHVPRDRTAEDPPVFETFRNKMTGEEMNSDPRMLPDALRKRGVPLQTFQLV